MMQNRHDGLTALKLVQSKLDPSSHLGVISEGGHEWNAYFSFNAPATQENLEGLAKRWKLPSTYEQFLAYCDGAVLYKDDIYGQWGYYLYGTHELKQANEYYRNMYEEQWLATYLAFGRSLGDRDLLLIDTSQCMIELKECYVIDGNSESLPQTWSPIARSFGGWLDYLVVAQGAKYWRWFPAIVGK